MVVIQYGFAVIGSYTVWFAVIGSYTAWFAVIGSHIAYASKWLGNSCGHTAYALYNFLLVLVDGLSHVTLYSSHSFKPLTLH